MSENLGCITAVILFGLASAFVLASCESSGPSGQSADEDIEPLDLPEYEEGVCEAPTDDDESETSSLEYLLNIGCNSDFQALASQPINTTLPGARSMKVVLDQADNDSLYFQNSVLYQIHYEFCSTHLSGAGLPLITSLSEFNTTEYYSPDRRFILAAVTFYEEPQVWALELSPYDTASVSMIEKLYAAVKAHTFFGAALAFHPTSDSIAATAKGLSSDVLIVTTAQLYARTEYQPLTLGTAIGRLHFAKAAELESVYVSYQDIMVLDQAPNDISVVQGLITEEFQTPLSHVNVLSQNRRTPNMGLRGAMSNKTLRSLENKIVKLVAEASQWTVAEVSLEEAEKFWEEKKPDPIELPDMDLETKGVWDIEDITSEPKGQSLRDGIKKAVLAFGGKAAHYSILAKTDDVPLRKAFAIPVYYYYRFMVDNGYFDRIDAFLLDEDFRANYSTRDKKLAELRADMMSGAIDEELQTELKVKIEMDYSSGCKLRFRTSTNSEDLDGFPCAGCYESHTGDPSDWNSVLNALRQTYASAWLFRTFEERNYYSIGHKTVGMALLVHCNFPHEEANGVAVTCNPFDSTGVDPAFYINVQYGGDAEVVHPPAGVTTDEILYYFSEPNQPTNYLSHSNLVPPGSTVLSAKQIYALGRALYSIHSRFSYAYGPGAGVTGFYAMDIEFKFDDDENPGEPPALYIKQARPYPGRGD